MNSSNLNRLLNRTVIVLCLVTLSACGGGSTGGTSAKTGYFIDSAVEGLQYKSGTLSGVTGANGSFQYEENQPVSFSIGKLELGSVNVINNRVFPVDLISGARDETHPQVSLLAQILQTLDSDGDPSNGITITEATRNAIAQTISITTADPTQASAALTQLLGRATQGRSTNLINATAAKGHLQANLLKEYAGNWSGTFSGGDQGNCQVVISDLGAISGTCASTNNGGGTFNLGGTVSSSGDSTATSGSASTGATFTGTYTRGGQVTGQWTNSQFNLNGTWTLSKR